MVWLISLKILIPIVITIIILIILLWIFYSKTRRLSRKISFDKTRFNLYKKHIFYLQNNPQNPGADLKRLNQLTRAFFKEYLNLNYSLTYLELAYQFKKQNKQDYANFCKLMSDINYKKKKVNTTEVRQAVDLFSKIISAY